jgi:thymidylate synthase ThyX
MNMSLPKVTLLNASPRIVETIFSLWEASKNDNPLILPEDVTPESRSSEGLTPEELFWRVINQKIPIGEHVNFVFMLENVSVSFREQMVRHRIGTKVGDNVGVDIVPDLAASSWWSQSMRIQDMSKFADDGMYRLPETLADKTVVFKGIKTNAETLFGSHMTATQEVYKALVAAGIPMEDAREVMPLGAQHRISWAVNLQSMLHVLGKRGCWILQLGIWGPIIRGMINELATKVHPMFRQLLAPPCIGTDGKFKQCQFRMENQRRITQDDKLPICPLYVVRDEDGIQRHFMDSQVPISPTFVGGGVVAAENRAALLRSGMVDAPVAQLEALKARAEEYRELWGHDPYTWA